MPQPLDFEIHPDFDGRVIQYTAQIGNGGPVDWYETGPAMDSVPGWKDLRIYTDVDFSADFNLTYVKHWDEGDSPPAPPAGTQYQKPFPETRWAQQSPTSLTLKPGVNGVSDVFEIYLDAGHSGPIQGYLAVQSGDLKVYMVAAKTPTTISDMTTTQYYKRVASTTITASGGDHIYESTDGKI